MFDPNNPNAYFEWASTLINSAHGIEYVPDGPHILEEGGSWTVITWRGKFRFTSGDRFEVSDNFSRKNKKRTVSREFSYQFMEEDGNCVFRFDTHGRSIPLTAPCHIHIKGGEPIEYQEYVDFGVAFRFAQRYIKKEPLPWDDHE